jgi:hypothetical protein
VKLRDYAKAIGLDVGCTDSGCIWGSPGGMCTNGGCRCLIDGRGTQAMNARDQARAFAKVARAALDEVGRLTPSDSDRTALATAVFELKERRGNYVALLARCTPATDAFSTTAYQEGIAAVDAAIAVVERMRGG